MTTQTVSASARSAWFGVDEAPYRAAPVPRPTARRPWGALALSLFGTACLIAAAALAVGLVLSGCASAETRTAAHEHRVHLGTVRAASQPAPGVTPAKWSAGWDEAERGAALLEAEVSK